MTKEKCRHIIKIDDFISVNVDLPEIVTLEEFYGFTTRLSKLYKRVDVENAVLADDGRRAETGDETMLRKSNRTAKLVKWTDAEKQFITDTAIDDLRSFCKAFHEQFGDRHTDKAIGNYFYKFRRKA